MSPTVQGAAPALEIHGVEDLVGIGTGFDGSILSLYPSFSAVESSMEGTMPWKGNRRRCCLGNAHLLLTHRL
jgi:hypothetical protein